MLSFLSHNSGTMEPEGLREEGMANIVSQQAEAVEGNRKASPGSAKQAEAVEDNRKASPGGAKHAEAVEDNRKASPGGAKSSKVARLSFSHNDCTVDASNELLLASTMSLGESRNNMEEHPLIVQNAMSGKGEDEEDEEDEDEYEIEEKTDSITVKSKGFKCGVRMCQYNLSFTELKDLLQHHTLHHPDNKWSKIKLKNLQVL
jgi:hypothetical protein